MTLRLKLPQELETRLQREAERQGVPLEALTLHLLDQHLPAADRRAAFLETLRQWEVEDAGLTAEEKAANASALRAVDEDRLSDRKLFTEILDDDSA